MKEAAAQARVFRFGDFELNVRSGELTKAGHCSRLQQQPSQLLCLLLEHAGEVVTRDEIRRALWPQDTFVDFDHGLNNAVNRLRESLGDSADTPIYIETLPRRGYRFIASVREPYPEQPQSVSEQRFELLPPPGPTGPPRRVPRFWSVAVLVTTLLVALAVMLFARYSSPPKVSDNARHTVVAPGRKAVTPEAYEDYLRGRYYYLKRTPEGLMTAINFFQRAIAEDPQYGPSYVGLANTYSYGTYVSLFPPRQAMPKAASAARRALTLDPSLGSAHAAVARVALRYEWDWQTADAEYRRAIALNPNDGEILWEYVVFLETANRYEEAFAYGHHAEALQPPDLVQRSGLGSSYMLARQYLAAIRAIREVTARNPENVVAHLYLGVAYEYSGSPREAITELEQAVRFSRRDPINIAALAHAYARAGEPGKARKILAQLESRSQHEYVSPYCMALVWVGLGDQKKSMQWLERAYDDRSFPLLTINSWPWWDPLRQKPEFQKLVREIGLDPSRAVPFPRSN